MPSIHSELKDLHMKTRRILAVVSQIVVSMLTLRALPAQQPGVRRTDLQQHDLSVPGREVVQVRVEIDPGVKFPKHSHPGEEIVYVLAGTLEYQVGDAPPRTLEAGDVLFIPAGAIHTARNVGRGPGAELATYVVEKGKPLVVIAK
jgi:quercetin dioxygenase-like cupin family protein